MNYSDLTNSVPERETTDADNKYKNIARRIKKSHQYSGHVSEDLIPKGVDPYNLINYDKSEEEIRSIFHREQSGLNQLGASLSQAVVGEILGGTIEGVGYLLDLPQYYNLMKGTETEFSNWFSDIGIGIKEAVKDAAPIYTDPDHEGQFSPGDWSWWMSNLPSVASTLSLMIPSGAAVKGISMGMRYLNAGTKLAKALSKTAKAAGMGSKASVANIKWAAKGITQASISRHMENLMESSGTMGGIIEELSNKSVGLDQAREIKKNYGVDLKIGDDGQFFIDEKTAKTIGAKAAAGMYKANWAMVLQDIPAYMLLRMPVGKSTTKLTAGLAKYLGREAIKPMAKKTAAVLAVMAGEGFEEGYQFVVGERARENALVDAGLMDKRSFGNALHEYVDQGEFWTSAFFGAIGAGVMQTAGRGITNRIDKIKGIESIDQKRINDLKAKGNFFVQFNAMKAYANKLGDEALSYAADTELVLKEAESAALNGNMEYFIEMLEGQANMTPEQMEDLGLPENYAEDAKKRNPKLVADLKSYAKTFDAKVEEHGPQIAALMARSEFMIKDGQERVGTYNAEFSKDSNEWIDNGKLSEGFKESFKLDTYEIPALKRVIATLESERKLASERSDTDKVNFYDTKIAEHKATLAKAKIDSRDFKKNRTTEERTQDTVYADNAKVLAEQQAKAEHKKQEMRNKIDAAIQNEEYTEKPMSKKAFKNKAQRLAAAGGQMAPKAGEAQRARVNSMMVNEIVDVSLFENKRLHDLSYQEKLQKEAQKAAKKEVAERVANKKNTVNDLNQQEEDAAGTLFEDTVKASREKKAKEDAAKKVKEDAAKEETKKKEKNNDEIVEDAEIIEDETPEEVGLDVARILDEQWMPSNDLVTSSDYTSPAGIESAHTVKRFVDEMLKLVEKGNLPKHFVDKLKSIKTVNGINNFIDAVLADETNTNEDLDSLRSMLNEYLSFEYNRVIKELADSQRKSEDTWVDDKTIENTIPEKLTDKESDELDKIDGRKSLSRFSRIYHMFKGVGFKNTPEFWSFNIFKRKNNIEYPLSKKIDRAGLDRGDYTIGQTVYYEVEEGDYNPDDAQRRVIQLVVYKNGDQNDLSKDNRKLIGVVPMSNDVNSLRRKISNELNDNKNQVPNSKITRASTLSKITGFSAMYNRTEERYSPVAIVANDEANKTEFKDTGGFRLAVTKRVGDKMVWHMPGVKEGDIGTAVKHRGQIAMVIRNPHTGEMIPIFGYAKKLGKMKGDERVDGMREQVWKILQESVEGKDEDTAKAIKKIVIFPKSHRNVNFATLKKSKAEFNKVFDESIANIDSTKMNQNVSARHNMGKLANKKSLYNEAISDFIEFNIDPNSHYKSISALVQNTETTIAEARESTEAKNKEKFRKDRVTPTEKKDTKPETDGKHTIAPARSIAEKVTEIKANKEHFKGVTEDGRIVELDGSEEYAEYIDTRTGIKYERVSHFIHGKTGIKAKEGTYLYSAQTIGTNIDALIRDIFAGKLKEDLTEYKIFAGKSTKQLESFINTIKNSEMYQRVQRGEMHVMADDVIVFDNASNTAGTIDLLFYDNEGNFYVHDMKTQRSMLGPRSLEKYDNAYKGVGLSDREAHSAQLNAYSIMLNNTHNVNVKGLGIIPVSVWYEEGDLTVSKVGWVLDEYNKEIAHQEDRVEGTDINYPTLNKVTNPTTGKSMVRNPLMAEKKPTPVKDPIVEKQEIKKIAETPKSVEEKKSPESKVDGSKISNKSTNTTEVSIDALSQALDVYNHATKERLLFMVKKEGLEVMTKVLLKRLTGYHLTDFAILRETGVENTLKALMNDEIGAQRTKRKRFNENNKDSKSSKALRETAAKKDDNQRNKIAPKDNHTEKWNEAEEMAWLKTNLPGVSTTVWKDLKEVVKNGPELWGVFTNASIHISKNAGQGTAYHEAFHAVFNLYLGQSEANRILSIYAKENGLKSPKTEAERIHVEEMLADEFSKFVMSKKKIKPQSWLAKIFHKLLNAMGIATKYSISNELFTKINQGYYAKASIHPNSFGSNVTRNSVAEWSAEHTKDVAQAINQQILMVIIPEMMEAGKIPMGFSSAEALDYIIKTKGFDALYKKVSDDFADLEDDYFNEGQLELSDVMTDILDHMFMGDGEFGRAINASISGFNVYNGINITMNNAKAAIDEDQNRGDLANNETSYKENWMTGATERSAKDNVSQQIKDFLRYLKIPGEVNLIGLPKYVDYQNTYNKLLLDLAGSITLNEMTDKLQKIINSGLNTEGVYEGYNVEYQEVLNKITADGILATQFFNAFNKQHAVFTHIAVGKDDSYRNFEANRTGVVNSIIKNWMNTALFEKNSVFSTDNEGVTTVNKEAANELLNRFNNLQAVDKPSDSDMREVHAISKALGIEIPMESLQYAAENNNWFNGVRVPLYMIVESAAKDGVNPFQTDASTVAERKNELKSLKELAETVKYSKPSLFESSYRNIEGKTVYSHLVANFVSTLTHKLTVSDTERMLDFYKQDVIYANNPILNAIEIAFKNQDAQNKTRLSEIFNVTILDGMNENGRKTWHSNMDISDRLAMSLALFHNNNNGKYSKYVGPVLSDAPNQLLFNMERLDEDGIIGAMIDMATDEYNRIQEQGAESENPIEFFDEMGEYHIMPMFNGTKGSPSDMQDAAQIIKTFIAKQVAELKEELINNDVIVLNENGTINIKESRLPNSSWTSENIDTKLANFYANDFVMNSAFSTLTVGDPAFYKPSKDGSKTVDYYKRAKEIYSPKYIPDTTAKYTLIDGTVIEAGISYTTAYLKDNKIKAPSYEELKKILGNSPKAKAILAHYGEGRVNETDAQAYITLPFYRRTMISLGRWNERYQAAFDRLSDSKGTAADMALVMQPLKPFVFGHIFDGKRNKVIPVQHKNSEFLLLPQFAHKNPTLSKLYDKMHDVDNNGANPIDVVNFESAVKVGASKKTDVDGLNSDPNSENNTTHIINMTDRGIQMETPEHFLDATNLFGTQIRKLIMSDLAMEGQIYMNRDGTLTKDALALHRLYEDILLADLAESYTETKAEFVDKDGNIDNAKISELLINEAKSRNKGKSFEQALELDENGNFKIPLFSPMHSQTTQSLINSFFRNRITKQKIAGGAFIQASSFGVVKVKTSESLKIVRGEDGGIDHAEMLLPAWASDFFKDFVDENGNLDFEAAEKNLPQEILEMVGYRIPTEDKYSMLPLKVVGFLSLESGGAVMLPAEITTISGSDFDVDKMYIMMKEFNRTSNVESVTESVYKALQDYAKSKDSKIKKAPTRKDIAFTLEQISKNNNLVDEKHSRIKKFYEQNISKFGKLAAYEEIKYDYKKGAGEQSKSARNNAKLDIMLAVLRNPATAESILNPGGYAKLKDQALEMVRDAMGISKSKSALFDHMTRINVANENMAGQKMVGIAANHNVHHALRQYGNLTLANPIMFNGKTGNSISITTPIEEYTYDPKTKTLKPSPVTTSITKNLAEFLAAVVDNAKDPLAASINYNEVTADVYSLLIASGFDILTATSFMSQPIVREVVARVRKGQSIKAVFNDLSKTLKVKIDNKTSAENLITEDLHVSIGSDSVSTSLQKKVFKSFYNYHNTAKTMGKLITASKADTKGLGATLADGEILLKAKSDLLNQERPLISGMADFLNGTKDSRLVGMFTEYGVQKPMEEVIQKLFPYNNSIFNEIKTAIEENSVNNLPLSANQRNLINDHFINFFMSGYEGFNIDNREDIVNNFPKRFFKYVNEHAELKANKFLGQQLFYENKTDKVNVDRIVMFNTGGLTAEERIGIENAWNDLFNSEHAEFAKEMVQYAYFTSGLGFGARGFSHYMPISAYLKHIKTEDGVTIPEYMRKVEHLESDIVVINDFISQFYRNMAENQAYVPLLEEKDASLLKDNSILELDAVKNSNFVIDVNHSYQKGIGTVITYTYAPFLSVKVGNVKKLFTLEGSPVSHSDKATYLETDRLGINNVAFEYNINDGASVSSVYDQSVIEKSLPDPVETQDYGNPNTADSFAEAEVEQYNLNKNQNAFNTATTKTLSKSNDANTNNNIKECEG